MSFAANYHECCLASPWRIIAGSWSASNCYSSPWRIVSLGIIIVVMTMMIIAAVSAVANSMKTMMIVAIAVLDS